MRDRHFHHHHHHHHQRDHDRHHQPEHGNGASAYRRRRHDGDDAQERHDDGSSRRHHAGGSLFGGGGSRKYLNTAERRRFVEAAQRAPAKIRLFCLMLRWSGARISEVLALTPAAIDIESGAAGIETLKRRKRGVVRQVPLPPDLLAGLIERSSCALRSAIRIFRLYAFGVGAARRRGATSRPSWRRLASPACPPCRRDCGTASASMPFSRACRRISCSGGLVTPRSELRRSMATC